MLIKHFILASILVLPQLCFSAPETRFSTVTHSKTSRQKNVSELQRSGKDYQINVQPLGVNPTGNLGAALSVGAFLDANSLIYFEGTKGAGTMNYFNFGNSYDIRSSSFGVHYKRFVGNSFYVRGGIDQRHTEYDHTHDGFIFERSNPTSSSFVGDSTAASLVIGNQWQWQTFTMGCDWIGLTYPFLHSFQSQQYSANADDSERSTREDDEKKYVTGATGQILRFYLGASF